MTMPPYARAASIREQLDRILGDPLNPLAPPTSLNPPEKPSKPKPAPAEKKKKPRARSAAVTDAKNILRAASAVTSKSLAAPQFIHRSPEIARHRRKCSVCHHPEREVIEDLFIHWHSPEAIASFYDDGDEELNEKVITWISIYRHAYAFGLDEIRRRNLRFVFEHILDQAGTTAATPASILVAARALASYVDAAGQWNEPPKRVIVTNIVRNEPPQSAPATQIGNHTAHGSDVAFVGADFLHRPAPSDASDNPASAVETNGNPAGQGSIPSSAPPAFVGADFLHRPASFPRDVVRGNSPSASASSLEIRNSLNSSESKEPPISNR